MLKLRHITKLSKLGKVINYARKGAALIEITSGTTNALLKLTGVKDTPFGTALSEYLFYLEMLSLSVDVTGWISKGLKKSSRDILKRSDDLEKHLDEIKIEDGNSSRNLTPEEKGKIIDELEEVAEISKLKKLNMAKKLWDDFLYEDLLKIPPTKKPCFLTGTLVATEKGLLKIEKLNVSDNVYTFNFRNNNVELKPILKLYKNKTEKYIKIYTSQDMLEVTGNHRFWLPQKEKWIPASKLTIEDVLMSKDNTLEKIIKLEVIESIENTYNLEVKDNSNYYVGNNKVLVHNANKVSKFASTELIEVEFYRIVEEIGDNMKSLYVGQTIQGVGKRFDQHKIDPKKAHWRNKMDGVLDIKVNKAKGPYKMTPYEAAVTEMYEMNTRGGKKGLYNKVNPIGKKKFNQFKKLGIFNPCKFYV